MIGAFGDMLGYALAGNLLGFTGQMLGMDASNRANLQAVRETNATNAANVQATNESNLEQVRLTNAANAEQANLAYQRSLPINQVRDLMDAGMSKAGALNKLAGGGVYTPPALQAATSQPSTAQAPHFDFSPMVQAFEQLSSLPANAVQLQNMKEQVNALRDEMRLKRESAERERQRHDYEMWKEQYGKDTALLLDTVSSKVSDALLQSGKDITDFKSFEDMLRYLKLNNDSDIKRMPHLARTQLEESVRNKFADSRALQEQENRNQEQKNRNQVARDAHIKALDDLKNSEFGRTLTATQWKHIDEQTKLLSAQYADYIEDMDNRDKERDLKKLTLSADRLRAEMGISREELQNSFNFEKDSDGHWKATPNQRAKARAKDFWQFAGAVVGVDYLGDILRGMVMLSPK